MGRSLAVGDALDGSVFAPEATRGAATPDTDGGTREGRSCSGVGEGPDTWSRPGRVEEATVGCGTRCDDVGGLGRLSGVIGGFPRTVPGARCSTRPRCRG